MVDITQDDTTCLEWLDVSLTVNKTVSDALGDNLGFRLANGVEVRGFLDELGIRANVGGGPPALTTSELLAVALIGGFTFDESDVRCVIGGASDSLMYTPFGDALIRDVFPGDSPADDVGLGAAGSGYGAAQEGDVVAWY